VTAEPHTADQLVGAKALVTGGGGFIGSHLCRRLADLGAEVHITSRRRRQVNERFAWSTLDTSDPQAVERVFAAVQPDLVFHLAGLIAGGRDVALVHPTLHANLLGGINVMSAGLKVGARRVVLTGSMEAPGAESLDQTPSSPYAAAKWAADGYARMFHRLYMCPVVTLRVFMVYGPGRQNVTRLVPYVVRSLLRGEQPRLSSGSRSIDWIYVDDVVDAFLAAATAAKDAEGGTFDVGSGTTVTIRDLVETIVGLVNPTIEPIFGSLPDRPLETSNVADVRRTAEILGWRPTTSLADGLQSTIDWFAQASDIELGHASA
jgi:nucleoside-diphosphate-sugar epimerase